MRVLRMTDCQHSELKNQLHRGDNLEAIALALCARSQGLGRSVLTVREVVRVPIEDCERAHDWVRWPTRGLYDRLGEIAANGFAVFKIHSHPEGATYFSAADDASDNELLSAVSRRCRGEHASAIMLPDGKIIARVKSHSSDFIGVDRVSIVGDDLRFDDAEKNDTRGNQAAAIGFDIRHRQLFGERTTNLLRGLTVAVIGASGTGSPVIEMLVRLGVGRILIIDDDVVEVKNLNRIYGTTASDAAVRRPKAETMKGHIRRIGLGTEVVAMVEKVGAASVWSALAGCDLVFGCMDTVVGRDTLSRLCALLTLPYIDMGVRIDADGEGGVESVSSAVHYLKPGGSSLKSRGVYNDADVYAETIKDIDPNFYASQVERGYIRGIRVDSPAVISINTATASLAVNEALARIHSFRFRSNSEFATQRLLFSHGRSVSYAEGSPDEMLSKLVGLGLCQEGQAQLAAA